MGGFVTLTAANGDKVAIRPRLVKGFAEYKLGTNGKTRLYYKGPDTDSLVVKEAFSVVLKLLDDA